MSTIDSGHHRPLSKCETLRCQKIRKVGQTGRIPKADKVAVDNAEPEVGFREFRYSVDFLDCGTSKQIPIIRLDAFIRVFIVVHFAPERITTSQIGAGCHRPLLNAVHVRKEFVPRIAAWKGRIWHRLAEEFT